METVSMKIYVALPCAFAALTSAAWAQSSVTLFGIVDSSMTFGRGSLTNKTSLGSGGWAASRLGFRGTEDLGGGLSANFFLETGFNTNDGSGTPSNTNNQASGTVGGGALTFGRRSYVTLASPLGEVRLGREYTPTYWNALYSDPFLNSGVGATLVYGSAITGVTRNRASNMVNYLSPKVLGGLSLNYMRYTGGNVRGSVTEDDGDGDQIRLLYEDRGLIASAAYGRTKQAVGDITMKNVMLAYDFGSFKPSLAFSRDSNGPTDGRGALLGVMIPVGAYQLKAAYSTYKTSAATSTSANKLAVGAVHFLSKRTVLYGTFARVKNGGGSTTALAGSTTAANLNSSGLDLGIAHTF
jgi:predicted porin